MSVNFEIEGLDEIEQGLKEVQIELRPWLAARLERFLGRVASEARSNLQNNGSVNTGDLNASIEVLSLDKQNLEGEVGTESPYAEAVEFGRGPVKPIRAKALHWVDPETGEDVFRKSAGPAEPRPFFWPAVYLLSPQFQDEITEGIQDLIAQATGTDTTSAD